MFYDEHNPPHIHVEYQGMKALLDFHGNILRGELGSKTALRLVREWIDLRHDELHRFVGALGRRRETGLGVQPL